MRAVVQRVTSAAVHVEGEEIFAMGAGLLALVGVRSSDAENDAEDLARRIVGLRIFADDEGRMNRALTDIGGTLGIVSQFTLMGDARKGRRPSFAAAARPEVAGPLVDAVAAAAQSRNVTVVTGRFRADMKLSLVNDGPVTILLDTEKRF
ncbi:MAG: D-tyrosyl-tRNA(Tyr) deacylase [Myxococcales bacterium]|nr:D-tyrosyl-tRNA(Tyr) deacylase [Myxococcales bacterium]